MPNPLTGGRDPFDTRVGSKSLRSGSGQPGSAGGSDRLAAAVVFVVGGDVADALVPAVL